MSNILTIVLRLVPKWVLLAPKQTREFAVFRGEKMKTRTVLRLTISLSLLALLASCAPSNNDHQSFQNSESLSSNIIGGSTADSTYAQKNGIVGILDTQKGGLCTGSLIAPNLIITAGHCVNVTNPTALLVFFTPNLSDAIKMDQATKTLKINSSVVRKTAQVIRHEGYGMAAASAAQNDIALIRIESAAPSTFQLAQLAPANLTQTIKAGNTVTLAGYGVSSYKSDPTTGRPLQSSGSGLLRKVDSIKVLALRPQGEEIMFDQSQGRGACHGDSGGPAYFTDSSNKTYLIGVTSRDASPKMSCDSKTIYTGIMGYSQWIQDNIKTILK